MNTVLFRRIMALAMLGIFILLVLNILFFHVLLVETGILYAALVAVFFLGGGMKRNAANDFEEQLANEDFEEPQDESSDVESNQHESSDVESN